MNEEYLLKRKSKLLQKSYQIGEEMKKVQSKWDKLRQKRNEIGKEISQTTLQLRQLRGD